MKDILKLAGTLTLTCLVAGILLAKVYAMTKGPIEAVKQKIKVAAIKGVLPPVENDPLADAVTVKEGDKEWTFYVGRKGGEYAGAAFECSRYGYSSDVVIMVGVTVDGKVQAIKIVSQMETPGLGANLEGDAFKGQFAGKPIDGTNWKVKKDGGDIDQITAATISSRAATDAIAEGLEVYQKHLDEIKGKQGRERRENSTTKAAN